VSTGKSVSVLTGAAAEGNARAFVPRLSGTLTSALFEGQGRSARGSKGGAFAALRLVGSGRLWQDARDPMAETPDTSLTPAGATR